MTRHPDDGDAAPVDDFASNVLDVVDSIPPGRVMSYGDIAEYLGTGLGPRQVGRMMAVYGGPGRHAPRPLARRPRMSS